MSLATNLRRLPHTLLAAGSGALKAPKLSAGSYILLCSGKVALNDDERKHFAMYSGLPLTNGE